MEFYENEDTAMFAETAAKFAAWAGANIDAERMASRATADNFNREMARQAGRAGLIGAPLPEELGGAGLQISGRMVVLERVAQGLAGPAVMLAAHWAGLSALLELAQRGGVRSWLTELSAKAESAKPWLCGTAVPAAVADNDAELLAVKEAEGALLISGEFICPLHPGLAEIMVIPLKLIGVPRILGVKGESLVPYCREAYPGSGLLELPLARLVLKEYPVSAEAGPVGAFPGEAALEQMRIGLYLGLSAVMAGNARAAAQYAWEYAGERAQTGRPIIAHQDQRRALEAMKTAVEAARATAFAAAAVGDDGLDRARRAFLFAGGACEQVCLDAVQALGGYGYMKDYGLERRLRDTKTIQLLHGAHSLEWVGQSW